MGKKWRYGIVFDAGSSGTRLHVYKWKDAAHVRSHASADDEDLTTLPRLSLEKTSKTRPGVSTFAENPADIGPDHLRELVDVALDVVPAKHVQDTPVFLMATAGMRLLPTDRQRAVLAEICTFLKNDTLFRVGDCASHVQIISGETEGLYGWIAANYLLGGFDHPDAHAHGKGHHTIGFLDMGGASAQIAFAPNATETERHANDLQLVRLRQMDGGDLEYKVFVATWLGFGANQARERYVETLVSQSPAADDHVWIEDPCMPKGLRTDVGGELIPEGATVEQQDAVSLVGSGDFEQCLKKAHPLLGKEVPCEDDPCLLDGKHVPAIDFDVNHFIGVSEFWHTTHGVFGKSKEGYDIDTYRRKVADFCGREWDDIHASIAERKKDTVQRARNAQAACFKAAWLISVLYDGIGIPRPGGIDEPAANFNVSRGALEHAKDSGFLEPFKPVDKIDGVDLSWTLGKMVLYASGEIPPSGAALPVGHGSNDAAVSDFEEPGSTWELPIPSDEYGAHGSRGPIIILLAILILLVGLFLRRREYRFFVWTTLGGLMRRHRRTGAPRKPVRGFALVSKLLGRNTPSYERVLEEGEADELAELAVVDSDESGSDSTDATQTGRGDAKLPLERMTGSCNPTGGVAVMSSLSALDRSGLVVRTESRERLSPGVQMLNAGRRSGATSPARL